MRIDKFKKYLNREFFILFKCLNIIRIKLVFLIKEIIKKLFKIIFIDVNFNIYPLINLKKISVNFKSFNNRFSVIFLNKLIYIDKIYDIKNLDKKFRNIYNFYNKNYIPLSILEFFFKKESNINLIKTYQKMKFNNNHKIINN